MSSLTAIFGSSDERSQDSEKLLHLYWNRAELKKEFAGMRKEQYKLKDRIKQQEGATARLQQKLDHLEELLVDPQWAHNVIAFYQLRGLALRCERKLARFAEQLKQQREQKQHNSILVAWNEQRARDRRSLEHKLLNQRDRAQLLEDKLQAERHRLMSMSGFLKVFRRRSVTAMLDDLAAQVEAAKQEESAAAAALEEVNKRKPPENQGLDTATKRSINLMILSFAQQLYLHFSDDDLAKLAKETSDKSVGAINYGNRDDCNELLTRVQRRLEAMEKSTDFAGVLQKRAKMLGENATFREESDAVPIAASVATVYNIDGNALVHKSEANILGENYWGISKILSR
ncbi:MAG: hypothetical protein ACREQZ_01130 [Woeseiaceae bacterium]